MKFNILLSIPLVSMLTDARTGPLPDNSTFRCCWNVEDVSCSCDRTIISKCRKRLCPNNPSMYWTKCLNLHSVSYGQFTFKFIPTVPTCGDTIGLCLDIFERHDYNKNDIDICNSEALQAITCISRSYYCKNLSFEDHETTLSTNDYQNAGLSSTIYNPKGQPTNLTTLGTNDYQNAGLSSTTSSSKAEPTTLPTHGTNDYQNATLSSTTSSSKAEPTTLTTHGTNDYKNASLSSTTSSSKAEPTTLPTRRRPSNDYQNASLSSTTSSFEAEPTTLPTNDYTNNVKSFSSQQNTIKTFVCVIITCLIVIATFVILCRRRRRNTRITVNVHTDNQTSTETANSNERQQEPPQLQQNSTSNAVLTLQNAEVYFHIPDKAQISESSDDYHEYAYRIVPDDSLLASGHKVQQQQVGTSFEDYHEYSYPDDPVISPGNSVQQQLEDYLANDEDYSILEEEIIDNRELRSKLPDIQPGDSNRPTNDTDDLQPFYFTVNKSDDTPKNYTDDRKRTSNIQPDDSSVVVANNSGSLYVTFNEADASLVDEIKYWKGHSFHK